MAELIDIFTGDEIEPNPLNYQFMQELTPVIVNAYDDLGLVPEHQVLLGKHLSDVILAVNPVSDSSHTCLCLKKFEEDGEYHRLAVINPDDIILKSQRLAGIIRGQGGKVDKETAERLSLDWVMFELSADALGNTVYMQQNFGRYVKDFDGQNEGYKSQFTVVNTFLEEYAASSLAHTRNAEYVAFNSGIALTMLEKRLINFGIVDSLKKAEWIVEGLRNNYQHNIGNVASPVKPLNSRELMKRIASIKHKDTIAEITKWVLAVHGPDVEDFLEDEILGNDTEKNQIGRDPDESLSDLDALSELLEEIEYFGLDIEGYSIDEESLVRGDMG